MEIANGFVVDAPLDHVWAYLLDVAKVAPCMPGAELTETVDDTTWKGNVTIRLGPVKMGFAGTVTMTERDDAAHHVVLKADGREQRGRGAASALITTDMAEAEGGTKVDFVTNLTITGAAAQYGRGMIQDISSKLTNEFAECLKANIGAEEAARAARPAAEPSDGAEASTGEEASASAAVSQADTSAPAVAPEAAQPVPPPAVPSPARPAPPAPPARTAKPVGGIRLGLWALWQAVVRFFKGLFGKGDGPKG